MGGERSWRPNLQPTICLLSLQWFILAKWFIILKLDYPWVVAIVGVMTQKSNVRCQLTMSENEIK